MTDVEAAEKVIASLTDRRDRAVQRSIEMTVERQKLGYEVHGGAAALAFQNRRIKTQSRQHRPAIESRRPITPITGRESALRRSANTAIQTSTSGGEV